VNLNIQTINVSGESLLLMKQVIQEGNKNLARLVLGNSVIGS